FIFFSSRRRHTRSKRDWSSDVCSSDLAVSRLLKTRQVREAKELREVTPADSFKNKIEQLIAYQEEKGYIIDMDEDEEGNIQIINYHCPIFNLASEYDVICSHEREIY